MSKKNTPPTTITLYYIAAFAGLVSALLGIYNNGFDVSDAIWLFFAFVYGIVLPATIKIESTKNTNPKKSTPQKSSKNADKIQEAEVFKPKK